MSDARIAGTRAPARVRSLSAAAALATCLALVVPAEAKDPVGGDLLVRLPEGRGERVMRSQVLDGGEGRAEYLAAGDVAELLRATSYWRSETRKLLLRMGDHRLTATVDNPFLILDGEVRRIPAAPRYQNGQVWLPLVTFDLLAEGDVVPELRWDAEHRVLSFGGEAEEPESAAALARRRDRLLAGDSTRSHGPSRPALVVLDPGHGGEDTGCVSAGVEEKHLTLELATRIRRHLAAAGFRTVLVRERDERVEVPRRVEIANSSRADLLVSLHFDLTAGGARRVRLAVRPGGGQVLFEDLARFTPGTVAASNTPESLDLVRWSSASAPFGVESYRMAQQIAVRIEGSGPALDAVVVERPVWNLEGAQMPAVAIEVGSPAGGPGALGKGELLEGLAAAVADGLVRYWWGGASR